MILVNDTLDRAVAAAQARAREAGTHVQGATWGAALVVLPLVVGIAAWSLAERPIAPAAALLGVLIAYHRAYLPLKGRLIPGARRQLLIDLALFCLPAFLAATALLGEDPGAMLDLAAVAIPPSIMLFRTGCLLGGCCHGRPSRLGVRYPGAAQRVLPLPLFEVIAGLILAILVLLAPAGERLPRLLVAYGGYRFLSEFLRSDQVGRTLGLTRTQYLAAAAVAGGLLC